MREDRKPLYLADATPDDAQVAQVRRIRTRLAAGRPVRLAVETLLWAGRPRRVEHVTRLLAVVSGAPDTAWRERIAAAWALGTARLNHCDRRLAARALAAGLRPRAALRQTLPMQRVSRCFDRAALAAAATWTLAVGAAIAAWNPFVSTAAAGSLFCPLVVFGVVVGACTLAGSLLLESGRARAVRAMCAWALGRLQSPDAVGPLAAAAAEGGSVGVEAWRGLARVLAAHDGADLDSRAAAALSRLAVHGLPAERLIVVIDALAAAGDERAVRPLEALAQRACEPDVREALARALPLVRERARRRRDAVSLLRPCGDADAAVVLVRVARDAADSGAARLVRAVSD